MNRAVTVGVVAMVALIFASATGAALQEGCGIGNVRAFFSQKKIWKNNCQGGSLNDSVRDASGWFHAGDRCKFDGKTTTWSTANGDHVLLFDTHPTGYLEYFVPIGRTSNGDVTKRISTPPRAIKAVLTTFSSAKTRRYAKDLFIAYPEGVVQLSLNAVNPIPAATLSKIIKQLTTHYGVCTTK